MFWIEEQRKDTRHRIYLRTPIGISLARGTGYRYQLRQSRGLTLPKFYEEE